MKAKSRRETIGLTPTEAALAFLTPPCCPKFSSRDVPPESQRFWVEGPLGKIAALSAGDGPGVLFVHGWGGKVTNFSSLMLAALHAGYRVIALDLPAHGASEGSTASIPDCAESLLRIQRTLGSVHALIGHSVGATIGVHAAGMGLNAERMVLISAPARYEDYARRFAVQEGLDARLAEKMIQVLDRMGTNIRSVSIPETAARLRQPALFIHSVDDQVVPFSEGQENARAWPGALFLQVEGLGHCRLLEASAVVDATLKFICNPVAPA